MSKIQKKILGRLPPSYVVSISINPEVRYLGAPHPEIISAHAPVLVVI